MSKETVGTGQIGPDEWEVLRRLKLESLDQEPIAFEDAAEGREKYLGRSEAEWRERLNPERNDRVLLFAKDPSTGEYVGTVSAVIVDGVATVQHVYVDSAQRGKGVGKGLLQDLIAQLKAREDVKTVVLQVLETQTAAIGLYHSLGFVDTKLTPNGAKRGDRFYNEIEMTLS